MLDVHPPHHPTHTWTDFFIHIATIIVGLLIAVGLEQTVEYIHHRHQAEQIAQALERESDANDEVVREDLDAVRVFAATTAQNMAGLAAAPVVNGKVHYTWKPAPFGTGWLPLSDASWLMARDSASFSQLPAGLVRNRWRVEYTLTQVNGLGDNYFNARYRLESMLHRAGDAIEITPAQRDETLLQAVEVESQLHHLYSSMDYFAILNRLARRPDPITRERILQNRPAGSNSLPWQ